MAISAFIVDAFTSSPFSGNPAAVCLLQESKPDEWLQQVAAEFNLSETAFLHHLENNRWHLRWFTPLCEVKLCGHATLAAAHVLLHEYQFDGDNIIFSTLSGDLSALADGDKIILDFPRIDISPITANRPDITILGLNEIAAYQAGEDIILELKSCADVKDYQPDVEKIRALDNRGLIITATASQVLLAENGIDFVSRFFAPNFGIDEDPVTGSAHCSLASLWSQKLNKKILRAQQLSGRSGILDVICDGSRVKLAGTCVTFLRGQIS